jgi:hypothetical protein
MKTVLVFAIFILLVGCASIPQQGAKITDEVVTTAEWTLCNAISVGAWRRAYAGDPNRMEGWLLLCDQPTAAPLKLPDIK